MAYLSAPYVNMGLIKVLYRTHFVDLRIDYEGMAVPALSYGCELWTTTKKQKSKIQASEMAFIRRVKRCSKLDLSLIHI